jgi:hypothetical protein
VLTGRDTRDRRRATPRATLARALRFTCQIVGDPDYTL